MHKIITIKGLLDQYFKEKPLSVATIETYKGLVNRFVIDTEIQFLKDVTLDSAVNWRSKILLRTSDVTWNNYLRHMRALWRFAIKKEYVEKTDYFGELNWGRKKKQKLKFSMLNN
jgi:hypothetical protein